MPPGLNWERAKERDLVRERGVEPFDPQKPKPRPRFKKPTSKQVSFIARLRRERGLVPLVKPPSTRAEASLMIGELLERLKPSDQRDRVAEIEENVRRRAGLPPRV